MKVLVIDDTQVHLQAALQTLVGHDITVCSTHKEAYELLSAQYDKPKLDRLMEQYKAEGRQDYYEAPYKDSLLPYWDVVLCDLLMPAGPMAQGGEGQKYVGQEMAVGWSLALRAAKMGAKYVAVVTDMNHHHHPASAMLDHFSSHYFAIDGARVLMTNDAPMAGIAGTECQCEKCSGTGKEIFAGKEHSCFKCGGTGTVHRERGKDWGEVLKRLLSDEKEYKG